MVRHAHLQVRRQAGLLADGLDDFRVAVARARHADAAREIYQLVAVGVPHSAPEALDEDALREAFYAGEEFRGRGDARFFRSLEGPRDGALEGLRPQSGLEHDGGWL